MSIIIWLGHDHNVEQIGKNLSENIFTIKIVADRKNITCNNRLEQTWTCVFKLTSPKTFGLILNLLQHLQSQALTLAFYNCLFQRSGFLEVTCFQACYSVLFCALVMPTTVSYEVKNNHMVATYHLAVIIIKLQLLVIALIGIT